MAQRLAQATHNRLVVGSNPTGPTGFALFENQKSMPLPRVQKRQVLSGVIHNYYWAPIQPATYANWNF